MNPDDVHAQLRQQARDLKARLESHGAPILKTYSNAELGVLGMWLTHEKSTTGQLVQQEPHCRESRSQFDKISVAMGDVANEILERSRERAR
jgi:hypothetical protein